MTALYWLRVLENSLKEKFPGIDVQVYEPNTAPVLYAMLKNGVQGVRVVMDGDTYEAGLVDAYERTDLAKRGNPSMSSPDAETVVEFIEDLEAI